MISRDFGIPLLPGRLAPPQIDALNVGARMVMWLIGVANAQSGAWFMDLGEFATWAECSHSQARKALDQLESVGWVTQVQRKPRGQTGKLGEMFRLAGDPDMTAAARAYQFATGMRAHSDERRMICAAVGTAIADVKLWQATCEQWVRGNHNPADVNAMLEVFEKRKEGRIQRSVPTDADYSGYKNEGGDDESGE